MSEVKLHIDPREPQTAPDAQASPDPPVAHAKLPAPQFAREAALAQEALAQEATLIALAADTALDVSAGETDEVGAADEAGDADKAAGAQLDAVPAHVRARDALAAAVRGEVDAALAWAHLSQRFDGMMFILATLFTAGAAILSFAGAAGDVAYARIVAFIAGALCVVAVVLTQLAALMRARGLGQLAAMSR